MSTIDNQVTIALISTVGGVIIAYLTVKYKDVVVKRNKEASPQDRMDTIFDGYEALIKQLQGDVNRKAILIEHLQTIVDSQRHEIEKSQGLINELRGELKDSFTRTKQLEAQLNTMKKDYKNAHEDMEVI